MRMEVHLPWWEKNNQTEEDRVDLEVVVIWLGLCKTFKKINVGVDNVQTETGTNVSP